MQEGRSARVQESRGAGRAGVQGRRIERVCEGRDSSECRRAGRPGVQEGQECRDGNRKAQCKSLRVQVGIRAGVQES